MPLEVRDLRAAQEDVLASLSRRLLLLDLDLHDVRRVLDDLGDVGTVARADLAQDTLRDPDDTADEPVALPPPPSVKPSPFAPKISQKALLTQKTPIVLYEQYGGRSGLIMQNMPWSCQLMKKTMKR